MVIHDATKEVGVRLDVSSTAIMAQMYVRMAIVAVVLSCGFIPETRPGIAAPRNALVGAQCGWLGVAVSPMTRAFADSLGMAEPYGAIFEQPEPGGPAAHEGIQAGDVVTSINGAPVMRSSDFAGMVAAYIPETRVDLSIFRDGRMIAVKVVLGSVKCPTEQHSGVSPRFVGL
jgi:membrane-associated protease RseP (regulator of RpoE activity)